MRAIRKGNDINILWDIMHEVEGQSVPYDLTGKDVTLYLGTPYGKEKAEGYKTEGNTVIWSYRGKDQRAVGVFSLILVINEGEPFMQTVDECKVFQIVEYSCQAGGSDNEGIKTETINLSTHIDIAAITPDTVLDPNSLNVVTNAAICEGIEGLRTYLNQQIADLEAKTGQDFSAFKGEIERIIAEFIASVNSDINTLSDTIITFKGEVNGILAEYAKNNAEIMENFRAEFEQLESSLVSRVEHELSKIADKANTTGYYPQLHVGLSDNLPDRGDVTEGLIGFRESAGADNSIEDGTANVQELLGESLVWNQGFPQGRWTVQDGTLTMEDDTYIVTPSGEYPGIKTGNMYKVRPFPTQKVFVELDFYFEGNATSMGINLCGNNIHVRNLQPNIWQHIYTIATCSREDPNDSAVLFGDSNAPVLKFKNMRFHNLTKMFGVGKEPSTIEEFEARKSQLVGVDFNAYNEGEVLGVNIKGIKSVNDNAFNGEYAKVLGGRKYCADGTITSMGFTREIGGTTEAIVLDGENKFIPSENGYVYASGTDICIHLVHTGYKDHVYTEHEVSESSFDLTPYFPNGMHGIGAVRDSVTPKKATRRFGVVDMGDMAWAYDSANQVFTSYTIMDLMAYPTELSERNKGLLCSKYSPSSTYVAANMDDKSWLRIPKSVTIKDSSYTDAASFKAAMSGVMLYYELATPIETEIDPQLNMNYKVWDFGTEELLTDSKSAPVLARTIYGFNATDTIRGNKAKNEEQDVRLQTLESEVVRVGDYQPDLSVGVADQLAGQDEPTASEINFRRSGGGAILDGNARIEAIKGNSVVWNNQSENSLSQDSQTQSLPIGSKLVQGHKYLMLAESITNCALFLYYNIDGSNVRKRFENTYSFFTSDASISANGLISGQGALWWYVLVQDSTVEYSANNVRLIDLTQMFGAGNEPTTIEEFYARKPIVEDEYAYNEGEVIHMDVQSIESVGVNQWDEEWDFNYINYSTGQPTIGHTGGRICSANFIRVIPFAPYYFLLGGNMSYYVHKYDSDYNWLGEPLIVDSGNTITFDANVAYIKFASSDKYGEGTTYNNDICINLSDASINGKYYPYVKRMQSLDIIRKYFPDGMKSAGTAHDEIRFNKASGKWEYSKGKIKSVDLGTFDYDLGSTNLADSKRMRALTKISDAIIPSNDAQVANILCSRYIAISSNDNWWNDEGVCISADGYLYVYDKEKQDTATFKAAMAGVILYYESNDWEWVELDKEDQLRNFDYQVWNCGTEQAIANVPSTPLKADIVYGFNAYGTIKQLKEQMATLMTQIAQMQTAMASVTSNKE